jgi:SAM-dependent methyltransferase
MNRRSGLHCARWHAVSRAGEVSELTASWAERGGATRTMNNRLQRPIHGAASKYTTTENSVPAQIQLACLALLKSRQRHHPWQCLFLLIGTNNMAHYTQQQFVNWMREFFPQFFTGKRVLEIGSLDINGSVRRFFTNCDYTGLDVGAGPGVDVVCGGQDFDAPSGSFDVVCSFEAMEHNPYWKETFANMLRLTRPGGMIIMTCATKGRPEHGTARSKPQDSPLTRDIGWDYYRNLAAKDFAGEFNLDEQFSVHLITHYYYSSDLLFFGFRSGDPPPSNAHLAVRSMRKRYLLRNSLQIVALKRWLEVASGRAA